jgi:hypothetical protein
VIVQPVEPGGLPREALRHSLASPRLEWDSLSKMWIPTRLVGEPSRGDVMMSGPWSHRGDSTEQRAVDHHDSVRRAVLTELGFYDHVRPDFEAPGYERRREAARSVMLIGRMPRAPRRQDNGSSYIPVVPWQYTTAGRYYDARFGRTMDGVNVDGLANGGADGSTYDATNASSSLTYTQSWAGALDGVTGTGAADGYLLCGGTAAQWRVHSGGAWTAVSAGQFTNLAANRMFWSNKTTGINSNGFGINMGRVGPSTGYRMRMNNITPATVYNMALTSMIAAASSGVLVFGVRIGSGSASRAGRSAGLSENVTVAEAAAPSDSDANAMRLGAACDGTETIAGSLGVALFHQLDSAAYLQSTVDVTAALARI